MNWSECWKEQLFSNWDTIWQLLWKTEGNNEKTYQDICSFGITFELMNEAGELTTWPWHFIIFFFCIPRQAEVALGVPGRLRPQIISTFGTTRVVGRQPYAPAALTTGEIPGTHFQRLSWPQGTWFCRKEPRKKSPVTPPGIDPGTIQLAVQRLNHYATPGPIWLYTYINKCLTPTV